MGYVSDEGRRRPAKKYGDALTSAIQQYCAYQERSHQEARNKLFELGATPDEVEQLLASLITEGFLDEERYARAYARGRWRIKGWGRVKITQGLKAQRVSEYCIRKAMEEIDGDEYYAHLLVLAARKWAELRGERLQPLRRQKVFRYLQGKGYESGLVTEAIAEITNAEH